MSFLWTACAYVSNGGTINIGLSTEQVLSTEPLKQLILPFEQRATNVVQALYGILKNMGKTAAVTIIPRVNNYVPLFPGAIIVSTETLQKATDLNA